MDFYETLGVDKNATESEIKKAYRSKAMILHPDRDGGDQDSFAALQKAYQVLSNKNSRAYYDETGEEIQVNKTEQEIREGLAKLFTIMLDTVPNLTSIDLIEYGLKHLNSNLASLKSEVKQGEKLVEAQRKVKNRMTRKSEGINIFETLIDQRIDGIENKIESIKKAIKLNEKIKTELNEYEWSYEAPQGVTFTGSSTSSTGGW